MRKTEAPATIEPTPDAAVRVSGAWTYYTGIPPEVLDEACAAMDPDAKHSKAYQDKRWDGLVRLWESDRFPTGLLLDVLHACKKAGCVVEVQKVDDALAFDTSMVTDGYLPGITLYDYQLSSVLAALRASCGVIRSPTASGKTEMQVALAKYFWQELGWRTLIITPKKGLASQWQARAQKYFGTDIKVGLLGDGKREDGDVIAATAQTLLAGWPREVSGEFGTKMLPVDKMVRQVIAQFEVIIGDEVHHASSRSWSNVFMTAGARVRYGFSGTPLKNKCLEDMTLCAVTGPILHEVASSVLIERGVVATPYITFICHRNASGPALPTKPRLLFIKGRKIVVRNQGSYAEVYRKGIVDNAYHNAAILRAALWMADRGRKVLVICRHKAHWTKLRKSFEATGIQFAALWGSSSTVERDRLKKEMQDGHLNVLLASTIFDEGEDVPAIDALVLAEGVKINTNVIQRIGRALRRKAGDNTAWIVDVVPMAGKKLIEHALERARLYETEGYETRLVEEWPEMNAPEDQPNLLPFETWNAQV